MRNPLRRDPFLRADRRKARQSKGLRAVGMANHRNPVAVLVPCHRVVGKNGSLTGYAGGLDVKEGLLALEKRCGG